MSRLFISEFILTSALLIAFTAHAQSRGAAPAAPKAPAARTIKNPIPSTATSITAGAAVYKKYCAFCHGVAAKGDGPLAPKDSDPPDLTDATWMYGSTDGEIFSSISNGTGPTSKMVAFKGKMPDPDLWHIVNYLRSLGPKTAKR